MTPLELVRAGACSPACLLAPTIGDHCRCRCGGQLHGALSAVDISTLIDARSRGLHRLTDLDVIAGRTT